MTPGKRRNPRLTLEFWLDQASSVMLLAIGCGIVPVVDVKWVRFVIGLIGLVSSAAGWKLTEPRRHWSNAERIKRGLDPVYPPFTPPALPPVEDDK